MPKQADPPTDTAVLPPLMYQGSAVRLPKRIAGKKGIQNRYRRLQTLYGAYSNDPLLENHRYRKRMVEGHGSLYPRLTFVVPTPSTLDVQNNQYLSGHERRVFVDLLRSIDLAMDNTFVTAALKYPLASDRSLRTAKAVPISLRYLNQELDVLKASTVVLFGRDVCEAIVPGVDLVHHHGNVVHGVTRDYVLMHHPVAALYNADIAKALFRDMASLTWLLHNKEPIRNTDV